MSLKKIQFEPGSELDFSARGEKPRGGMPLVDSFVNRERKSLPLGGLTVLLIQHQLGNQIHLIKALHQLGVEYKDILWLDIPYTSSKTLRKSLVNLGIPRENLFVSRYLVTSRYSEYQRKRVQKVYIRLLKEKPERLLVLDDGAYFLEALATFRERLPGICIVEQTARGIFKIDENPALKMLARTIPIIDVATSKPKVKVEAPFIGISINSALHYSFNHAFKNIHEWKCLVLGYGAVGSNVARFLGKSLNIQKNHTYIFDTDKKKIKKARESNFKIWDRKDYESRFNLVIGCTGKTSFGVGDSVYLDNKSILVSASSGSSELSRQEFIELADSSDIDDVVFIKTGIKKHDVHVDLKFKILDKQITFLNGGFPINFNGVQDGIPDKFIQPTIMMMLQGSLQAVKSLEKGINGIINLDKEFCKEVKRDFKNELLKDGYKI